MGTMGPRLICHREQASRKSQKVTQPILNPVVCSKPRKLEMWSLTTMSVINFILQHVQEEKVLDMILYLDSVKGINLRISGAHVYICIRVYIHASP